jgi:putative salt-induced outer membrane protein
VIYRLYIVLALAPAFLTADQVTLKNGDRVSGQIVKKDGDKLTIKTEFMGEVTMPWPAVTSIVSDGPVTVVLPGEKSVTGSLITREGQVQIVTSTGSEAVPLAEITAVRSTEEQTKFERLLHPSLLDLWAGYLDFGLALARGNARTSTFTTAFNTSRVTRNDKITIYLNQIRSTATLSGITAATASAIRGGWAYDRNVRPRLFVNVFNDYEKDRFQNLDLRFVAGGGLGFTAVQSERSRLDLLGGLDYNRSNFSPDVHRNSVEAYFGDDWTFKLSGITALNQSFRIFPNLTNSGEYRMNFELGAVTTLKKWLSWQLTASDRYLSHPALDRRKNDILLTTGFRLSFAR